MPQLLTADEARSILRLDPDYPDEEINPLVGEATSYIDQKTNFKWEGEANPHPLAKLACRYKLQQIYYHDEEHDFEKAVIGFCEDLRDVLRLRESGDA